MASIFEKVGLGVVVVIVVGCTSMASLKKECDEGKVEACEKACEKGELGESGCVGAAQAFASGQGVPMNKKPAQALLTKACDGKVGSGCLKLAGLKEGEEAMKLADRACEYGEKSACDLTLKTRIDLVRSKRKFSQIPPIQATLKTVCGPEKECGVYRAWLDDCTAAVFMFDGLTGMNCPDYEADCATRKQAAVRPYCAGEKAIPELSRISRTPSEESILGERSWKRRRLESGRSTQKSSSVRQFACSRTEASGPSRT